MTPFLFWSLLALAFAAAAAAAHRPRKATWIAALLLVALAYGDHLRTLTLRPEAVNLEGWGPAAYLVFVGLWVGTFLLTLSAGLRLWVRRRPSRANP
ncbi:hypothetical protein [Oceanithermus sp.]|uniref:hypothetical protein n=1 Tax=Oceanithermus sp. TaxID=2268145 RepID=UPI00257FE13D|nr:hypothetical protein [Oceanithermus sp.]